MTTVGTKEIASEQGHWYDCHGNTAYTQLKKKGGGTRATTITDARRLNLYPSVTTILSVADKPGLRKWKEKQILMAALTLPMVQGETLDDYAERVSRDAKQQVVKAAERGTALHTAIEDYIKGQLSFEWQEHIDKVNEAMTQQFGFGLAGGSPEKTFCCTELGYGGKLDYINEDPFILDFKSKDRIIPGNMVYDEHLMQLGAYGMGTISDRKGFRAANIFVGVEDKEVRIYEHEWQDLMHAYSMFTDLLSFWQKKNKFGKYSEEL